MARPIQDEWFNHLQEESKSSTGVDYQASQIAKLVVLIGDQTAGSEWVQWEVDTFYKMKKPLSGENADDFVSDWL